MLRKTLYQPITVLVLWLCVFTSAGFAQEKSTSGTWTIQSESLDVKSYEQIAKAMKSGTDFQIKEACIPAGLMVIELKENAGSGSDRSAQLLELLQDLTQLSDLQLSPIAFDVFRERCAAARLRPVNK